MFREKHRAHDVVLLSTAAHDFLGLFTGLLHLPLWLKVTVRRREIPGGILHRVVIHLGVLHSPEYFMSLNDCAFGAVMEQRWSSDGAAVPCRGLTGTELPCDTHAGHCSSLLRAAGFSSLTWVRIFKSSYQPSLHWSFNKVA